MKGISNAHWAAEAHTTICPYYLTTFVSFPAHKAFAFQKLSNKILKLSAKLNKKKTP
jgi:hypothetical protein